MLAIARLLHVLLQGLVQFPVHCLRLRHAADPYLAIRWAGEFSLSLAFVFAETLAITLAGALAPTLHGGYETASIASTFASKAFASKACTFASKACTFASIGSPSLASSSFACLDHLPTHGISFATTARSAPCGYAGEAWRHLSLPYL